MAKARKNYLLSAAERHKHPEKHFQGRSIEELEHELGADWAAATLLPHAVLTPVTVATNLAGKPAISPALPNYSNIAHFQVSFVLGQIFGTISDPLGRRLFAGASAALAGAKEGIDIARGAENLADCGYDAAADVAGFFAGAGYQEKVNYHFYRLAGMYSRLYDAPIFGITG